MIFEFWCLWKEKDQNIYLNRNKLYICENINDTMKKTLIEYFNEGYFIIIFTLEELSYNILNHTLVPPHRILNETETNEIKNKYNIRELRNVQLCRQKLPEERGQSTGTWIRKGAGEGRLWWRDQPS